MSGILFGLTILLNVGSEKCLKTRSECSLQRVIADRTLQVCVDRLQQRIIDLVFLEGAAKLRTRRGEQVCLKIHLLEGNLTLKKRFQRNALVRIAQDLQQFVHFQQFLVCEG